MQRVAILLGLSALCLVGAAEPQTTGGDDIINAPGIGSYYLNSVKMNWTDAYTACKQRLGHLVIMESQEEATAVRDIMIQNSLQYIHAGYHNIYTEGRYETLKGDKLNELGYSKWTDGYPTNSVAYNCGGYRRTGLVDTICAALEVSLCELPVPSDYEYLPGFGFYKAYDKLLTWPQAFDLCESEGAHLTVLRSEAELEAIIGRYGVSSRHLGVHRLFERDNFHTIFDEPLETTGYTKFSGEIPSPDTERNYGSYNGRYGIFLSRKSTLLWALCKITYP